eukprot:TRINITY_DN10656_c0_g1_i3.p1 TRINITY_DN10656_c0_g1~~TRINITY_DN10656_c0_g1_i3.p1  ORF type:complete len:722 (-),score=120.07 TRINITY_DN10656_c0_g1_i3:120-2285(-)
MRGGAAVALFGWVLLVVLCTTGLCFDPDAGLRTNYIVNATLTTTAGGVSTLNQMRDGNLSTYWASSGCLPMGYVTNSEANLLLNVCRTAGACNSTNSNSDQISSITDGTADTGYQVNTVQNSNSTIFIQLPSSVTYIRRIGFRFNGGSPTIQFLNSNAQITYTLNVNTNYQWINSLVNQSNVVTLKITSTSSFILQEIALMSQQCFETVHISFPAPISLGWIQAKLGNPTSVSASLYYSQSTSSNTNFTFFANGNTSSYEFLDIPFNNDNFNTINIQNVSSVLVKFTEPDDVEYLHVQLFEMRIFDMYGPYGPPARDFNFVQNQTFKQLLAINGIWGWGSNGFYPYGRNQSFLNQPFGDGPGLYSVLTNTARNYHNLDWDISTPQSIVNYTAMALGAGTQSTWWLNWDAEYSSWKQYQNYSLGNFTTILASIQFTNSAPFAVSNWGSNPAALAYQYAKNFAAHFGPTQGNGLITAFEVGNEPWDFPASFYTTLLSGMISGISDTDPNMLRFPCALQADSPDFPREGDGVLYNAKYIGYRVLQNQTSLLSGINHHSYSYAFDTSGIMRGVPPDSTVTTQHSVRNMIRWRDANMPGKPVYLTEFGWDGSDDCTDSRCVTLQQQAAYAVRGILTLAREGLDRLVWYFYSDLEGGGYFANSGLTTYSDKSIAKNYKKPVYYAVNNLIDVLGDYKHYKVIVEDGKQFVYMWRKDSGETMIGGWRNA